MKKVLTLVMSIIGVAASVFCLALMNIFDEPESIVAGVFAVMMPTVAISLVWATSSKETSQGVDTFAVWCIMFANLLSAGAGFAFSTIVGVCLMAFAVFAMIVIIVREIKNR